ncbi:MAG TPA: hydroxyacid dehydrogenase, partial [Rhodospirillales bacterium]|nr:hydroxyacid dehydrogenase [Rhodospirillales bacterium]
LGGRTVGLAGMGAVPRLLAPVLEAMGAEVIYTARHRHGDVPWRWCGKEELLARADILSLHMPLTPETAGWLDGRAMATMRPGAILINTARGGLVDETALLRNLDSGRIAAAGLDVFAEEPPAPDHPLFRRENLVCAPHVAWFTTGTLARSLEVAIDNCRRLATGRPLRHRVV